MGNLQFQKRSVFAKNLTSTLEPDLGQLSSLTWNPDSEDDITSDCQGKQQCTEVRCCHSKMKSSIDPVQQGQLWQMGTHFQKQQAKFVLQEKIIQQRKINYSKINYFKILLLFSLLYSSIPDANVREIWRYRFIKRTSNKYNTMGYLTEAENISQILSEQII